MDYTLAGLPVENKACLSASTLRCIMEPTKGLLPGRRSLMARRAVPAAELLRSVWRMIEYASNRDVANEDLNALFSDAWANHTPRDFSPVLARNLGHVCALADGVVVGFVNVAWDGGAHAFLLDPTVRSDFQRQGIGTCLVRHAVELARAKDVEWLHVDYEPCLAEFYAKCGFRATEAGLMNLKGRDTEPSVSGDA
jgi:GNAT superfamily N-acetyltransferase